MDYEAVKKLRLEPRNTGHVVYRKGMPPTLYQSGFTVSNGASTPIRISTLCSLGLEYEHGYEIILIAAPYPNAGVLSCLEPEQSEAICSAASTGLTEAISDSIIDLIFESGRCEFEVTRGMDGVRVEFTTSDTFLRDILKDDEDLLYRGFLSQAVCAYGHSSFKYKLFMISKVLSKEGETVLPES